MTDFIVIGIFTLIQWAAFGFMMFIILLIISLPILGPYTTYKTNQRWLKINSLNEYWAAYPDSKTRNGSKCHNCGSGNIRQYGFENGDDTKRVNQCNQCNTWLYRTGEKK